MTHNTDTHHMINMCIYMCVHVAIHMYTQLNSDYDNNIVMQIVSWIVSSSNVFSAHCDAHPDHISHIAHNMIHV